MGFRSRDLTVKLFADKPLDTCPGEISCCGCSDTQDCQPSCKQTEHGKPEKIHALGALRQQLHAALALSS